MTGLTSHTYEGRNVRTSFTADNQPLFVARDVFEALDIAWRGLASIEFLDGDEFASTEVIDALGRGQETILLTESGLYATIFQSRKPEARKFRKWVTSELLPSLRKTGSYALSSADVGYTISTQGEARVQQLRALAQCERYITLYTARRDAVLRGESPALAGSLSPVTVEGAVPILDHLRATFPEWAPPLVRMRTQQATERCIRRGLPVGRALAGTRWVRTARPQDIAAVLTEKGGA